MKKRIGFVSNSSSCSFYISINTDRKKLLELSNLVYRTNEYESDFKDIRFSLDRDLSEFCLEVEASINDDSAQTIASYLDDNGIKYKCEGVIYNED